MSLLRYCLLLIFSIVALSLNAQNFNRPIPLGDFYNYEFVIYDSTDFGYYFTTPLTMLPSSGKAVKPRIALLDKHGYFIWYSTSNTLRFFNFQYHPENNLMSCYFQNNPHGFHFLDSTFQIVDSYSQIDGLYVNPHEFQVLPNGNVALTLYQDSIMDLSAYTIAGVQASATTKVIGDMLIELDAAKNIVFRWSTFDDIYPTEAYDVYGYYANGYDYTHANAVAEDTDGHFLICFRHLDAVYKINRNTAEVMWRLGGKSNDFTFVNDNGFSAQHDFRAHADGSYSLFDNGFPSPNECRAVSYILDTVNWTATKIWEYKPDPAFPALLMGNHQVTDDLNHMINYGTSRRPFPSAEFVDNAGNFVSQIFWQDSILSYRVLIQKVPFQLPRPVVTCTLSTDALILSAPQGFQQYKWSTGETTQHITVSDTGGVYQVWVNYGLGMLGSEPFFINDAYNCEPMTVNEYNVLIPKGDYIIYDMLGRQILKPQKGQIYIYRYQNGFVELKYITNDW